ncbi:hypothetical protein [Methylobacterium bullatum]|uniref:hypothetical protein n=1 Tax=Methylobacterium bullatum TaxID=570505 RepID=UPI0030D35363
MSVGVLDFLEVWWCSVEDLLNAGGVSGRFARSPLFQLNSYCSINLRRGEVEADLLVWESGEAELSTTELNGIVKQHFDNVQELPNLILVLSKMSSLAVFDQK